MKSIKFFNPDFVSMMLRKVFAIVELTVKIRKSQK